MASLHIVYDPDDRIHHDNKRNKEAGIKFAVMPVNPETMAQDKAKLAQAIAEMLLEQIAT